MDKDQSLRKDYIEAWKRYADNSYTSDDLALVLDLIRDDANMKEFKEVWNNVLWREANEMPPTPEDRKEIYRKEFAQLLAEYQNKQEIQKMQTIRIPSRNRFRKIWYAAAAAILLGLLIPAAYLYMKPKTEQTTVQYVEMSTLRGEIKTIVLSDDTKVTLNAGSSIKYPANFIDNERPVELCGEAMFDVTSDPSRPFTVKTKNMKISVLGTVFNVKEYENDVLATVSVASGKVEVDLADGKALLEKNQQVKMDKATGNFEKWNIDADKYLSWTDRALYFHRTSIREVVNVLNRHYSQVDIKLIEADYSDILLSGEYENIYTAEEILKSIVYVTDLKCSKTGKNEYTLYK